MLACMHRLLLKATAAWHHCDCTLIVPSTLRVPTGASLWTFGLDIQSAGPPGLMVCLRVVSSFTVHSDLSPQSVVVALLDIFTWRSRVLALAVAQVALLAECLIV